PKVECDKAVNARAASDSDARERFALRLRVDVLNFNPGQFEIAALDFHGLLGLDDLALIARSRRGHQLPQRHGARIDGHAKMRNTQDAVVVRGLAVVNLHRIPSLLDDLIAAELEAHRAAVENADRVTGFGLPAVIAFQ